MALSLLEFLDTDNYTASKKLPKDSNVWICRRDSIMRNSIKKLSLVFLTSLLSVNASAGLVLSSMTYQGKKIQLIDATTNRACVEDIAIAKGLIQENYGSIKNEKITSGKGWITLRGYLQIGYERAEVVATCYDE